jgi:hypothetical protein
MVSQKEVLVFGSDGAFSDTLKAAPGDNWSGWKGTWRNADTKGTLDIHHTEMIGFGRMSNKLKYAYSIAGNILSWDNISLSREVRDLVKGQFVCSFRRGGSPNWRRQPLVSDRQVTTRGGPRPKSA